MGGGGGGGGDRGLRAGAYFTLSMVERRGPAGVVLLLRHVWTCGKNVNGLLHTFIYSLSS